MAQTRAELVQQAKTDPRIQQLIKQLQDVTHRREDVASIISLLIRHRKATEIYRQIDKVLQEKYGIAAQEIATALDEKRVS